MMEVPIIRVYLRIVYSSHEDNSVLKTYIELFEKIKSELASQLDIKLRKSKGVSHFYAMKIGFSIKKYDVELLDAYLIDLFKELQQYKNEFIKFLRYGVTFQFVVNFNSNKKSQKVAFMFLSQQIHFLSEIEASIMCDSYNYF